MLKTKIPARYSVDDWKRLPKPRERLCDLSRTTLLELHEHGDITVVALRKPGALKASRLVYMRSLYAYLQTCIEESVPKALKTPRVPKDAEQPGKLRAPVKQEAGGR